MNRTISFFSIACLLASSIFVTSCTKDDDDDTTPIVTPTRLTVMEKTGPTYEKTRYTYNSDGLVSRTVYEYVNSEYNIEKEVTTNYVYNSEGQPISWTISGDSEYTDGEYNATITSTKVTITDPDGDETVYNLNSAGKARDMDNGFITIDYTWASGNVTKNENSIGLNSRMTYDMSHESPIPALGDNFWTSSLNLILKSYLVVDNEEALLMENTYQFNENGKPTSCVETNYLMSDEGETLNVTYTYEEY